MLPRHTRILSSPHCHHGSESSECEQHGMELVTEPAMSLDGLSVHLQEKLTVYRTKMALSFIFKKKKGGGGGDVGELRPQS